MPTARCRKNLSDHHRPHRITAKATFDSASPAQLVKFATAATMIQLQGLRPFRAIGTPGFS